ncbi:ethanolamine utilization cobalamin adenosyltransferase [Algoriphagus sp. 4150]|uniref:hypothetical protein n=1 Tax=Algoriphagus sp. 4150 TaxID=2817756 RepID=UPI00285588E9|nr:hypothetical protein [Algoriphagus sp. 4150]MDR7130677.1 ethanolamine utilization cobalamin adenosyltransferase [Algoriphagus sp. 4150]
MEEFNRKRQLEILNGSVKEFLSSKKVDLHYFKKSKRLVNVINEIKGFNSDELIFADNPVNRRFDSLQDESITAFWNLVVDEFKVV